MFGLSFRWRKKKVKSNPDHYPLDTCKNLYRFIVDRPDFNDAELVDIIRHRSSKRVTYDNVLDLVRVTRSSTGYYKQPGNRKEIK